MSTDLTFSPLRDVQRSIAAVQAQLLDFNRRLATLEVLTTSTSTVDTKHQPSQSFNHSAVPRTFLPTTIGSSDPWLHHAIGLLPKSLARSTISGYDSTIQRFLTFCNDHDIPVRLRFPTHEPVLCAFAASFAHRATGGSLANTMAALKTWHGLHNATWQGGPRLSYIIKAVGNCAPPAAVRPSRPGVSVELLRLLHDDLDLQSPKDAAIYAIACVAFWGMCRLGELLGSARRFHDPMQHPSRGSVDGIPHIGNSIDMHLPRTKTSQREGATIRLLAQHGRTDPIYALANHFHVNYMLKPDHHLFAYYSPPAGSPRCITKEEFLSRCNQIWQARGKDRLSGHNFRIGGANHFLDNKVPSDIVRSMGRWKSGAFYRYWRKPEDKAVRFAQHISEPSRARGRLAHDASGRLAKPAHVA